KTWAEFSRMVSVGVTSVPTGAAFQGRRSYAGGTGHPFHHQSVRAGAPARDGQLARPRVGGSDGDGRAAGACPGAFRRAGKRVCPRRTGAAPRRGPDGPGRAADHAGGPRRASGPAASARAALTNTVRS